MIALMKRDEEMRELFARWKRSGQSLLAFGKAEGVGYAKLLYWRKKLGDDARKATPPKRAAVSSELVPVRVVPDPSQVQPAPGKFEVWFTNGTSLDVPAGFDEDELRRLLGVLLAC